MSSGGPANPACTMSARLPGMDLVFEGEAERVTDPPSLEAIAAVYRAAGWPVEALLVLAAARR
jgi:hypothetical protein